MTKNRSRRSVLVISCSGGAGHVRAGEALKQWADERYPGLTVEHHDVLDYTSPSFKRLYARGYFQIVQKARHIWGAVYDRTATTVRRKSPLIRVFDHFNYQKYARSIRSIRPDAIICTHFLPFLAVDRKIADLRIPSPFYAVGTDFNLHALWVSGSVRRYFVFSDETAALLSTMGVSADRIVSTGIPLMLEFSHRTGKKSARRRVGLPDRGRTVLVLTGGEGMGHVLPYVSAILHSLAEMAGSSTVVVIAGRNEKLAADLRTLPRPSRVALRVEGFIGNMYDFMRASDLVVTKSGGLSSSESLACGRPMIITDPIPGQERLNADVLLEHGAALIASGPQHAGQKVIRAFTDRDWMKSASKAARHLARPRAAENILGHIELELLKHVHE